MYHFRCLAIHELDGIETKEIGEDKLPLAGGPGHECTGRGFLCGGGRSSFVIDWKGNLMPCNRMHMISASALEEGFQIAWAEIHRRVIDWPQVPECRGCAYAEFCSRCPATMLEYAPPGKQPVGMCERLRYYARNGVLPIRECE